MRFHFIATLATLAAISQAVYIQEDSNDLASPLNVAEVETLTETYTEAELEAQAEVNLEAFVDAVLQSNVDSGALVLSHAQTEGGKQAQVK